MPSLINEPYGKRILVRNICDDITAIIIDEKNRIDELNIDIQFKEDHPFALKGALLVEKLNHDKNGKLFYKFGNHVTYSDRDTSVPAVVLMRDPDNQDQYRIALKGGMIVWTSSDSLKPGWPE